MEEKIELEIMGITITDQSKPSYVIVLKEKYGNRRLPIVIGTFEARSIALKLENYIIKRPITHDLIVNIFKELDIHLLEIVITKMEEDIFYAELVVEHNGKIYHIDSRPSDAIAVAVRTGAPIYATKSLMDKHGLDLEKLYKMQKEYEQNMQQEFESESNPEEKETSSEEDYLRKLSLSKLKELMQKAIAEENYELASKIRDEIKRRKGEL